MLTVELRQCKAKKVKCGEEKPRCSNCDKNGEDVCDYSIRLNWDSKLSKRKGIEFHEASGQVTPKSSASSTIPGMGTMSFAVDSSRNMPQIFRSHSHSTSRSSGTFLSQVDGHSRSGSPTPTASSFSLEEPSPILSPPPPLFTESPIFSNVRPSGPHPTNSAKRPRHGSVSEPVFGVGAGYGYVSGYSPNFMNSYVPTYNQNNKPSMRELPQFTDPYTHEPLDPILYREDYSKSNHDTMPPPRSSIASQEDNRKMSVPYDPDDDPRRMSVNSLLIKEESEAKQRPAMSRHDSDDRMQFYGIDRGLPDLDIPRNNDQQVLDVTTPVMSHAQTERRDSSTEFGFSSTANSVAGYASNLHVKISKTLLPLPSVLHNNPMNLMYFHFFIEHTARILVPHDCPANPFKIILPQSRYFPSSFMMVLIFTVAVRDDDLLYLLLAYSASHRARLLDHPEPTNRIAYVA